MPREEQIKMYLRAIDWTLEKCELNPQSTQENLICTRNRLLRELSEIKEGVSQEPAK